MNTSNDIFEALDVLEEEQETPIAHRVAKVMIAAGVGMLATWCAERAYDKVRDWGSNDDEDVEIDSLDSGSFASYPTPQVPNITPNPNPTD